MSGNKTGGRKMSATIRRKYGADFWAKNGALGGKASSTGGYWHLKYVKGDVEAVRADARRGGKISRKPSNG